MKIGLAFWYNFNNEPPFILQTKNKVEIFPQSDIIYRTLVLQLERIEYMGKISTEIIVKKVSLSAEYDDISSIEYKGILYVNINYNASKYGNKVFSITI